MQSLLAVAMMLLALGGAGCAHTPQPPKNLPPRNAPLEAWVVYQPEEEREVYMASGVLPVPYPTGWTIQRMQQDTQRIAQCGIKAIMVNIAPATLANQELIPQLRQFFQCAKDAGIFAMVRLSASHDSTSKTALRRNNLTGYLARLGYGSWPGVYRQGDLAVVVVSEGFVLRGEDAPNHGIAILQEGKELPALSAAVASSSAIRWIRAGWRGNAPWDIRGNEKGWPLPREKGATFRRQVATAYAAPALRIVLLQSWNCHKDGSHIQPDSQLGEALSQWLKGYLSPQPPLPAK